MVKHLRKRRDTLRIAGLGVIAFGLWSMVRTVVYTFAGTGEIRRILNEPELQNYAVWLVYMVTAFFFLADLGLRIYVGIQARRESLGKHNDVLYLIVTGFLIGAHLVSVPMDILLLARGENQLMETLAALFIELTSMLTLGVVMWSAVSARHLEKMLLTGEEDA